MPQIVVVVDVLVSQGDVRDALRRERPHRVFHEVGSAVAREAHRDPVEEPPTHQLL